ncbi:MAG: NAD(P)H-hydrate dehydratase [Planctomycetota bacterium]|nr:NAD(P)H-hydrate dehydratase [Planctomycetota bacterium]
MTGDAHAPVPALLPARDPDGHKGTFGTVLVVGGCCADRRWMAGAPTLAALGALRAGAGLVRVLAPDRVLPHVIGACPAAVGYAMPTDLDGDVSASDAAEAFDRAADGADAIVIGPGLGPGPGTAAVALRGVQRDDIPIVVDADALNALAQTPDLFRDLRARAIFTPHPGEFARLASALRITHSATNPRTRVAACQALAQRLGCVCVLKGAGTVVGDAIRAWTCGHRTPVLGTGGTGDVLAGLLGGLLAQFAGSPHALSLVDLASAGVEAHARAGERWTARHGADAGMLPTELADELPGALAELRAPTRRSGAA